jgi:aminoglycoside phosphotransferase (APT) family kinase protein
MTTERCAAVPAVMRDPERIDKAFWVHLTQLARDRPFCLLHGDTHPGNGFVDVDGTHGFYDWQSIAKGPWAFDIAYHIVTSLDVAERRRRELELIQFYLQRLAEYGVSSPPSFDSAWLQYRRYIAYGLHIWITNPAHFQSEANCTALTTRLTAAAADLDFFGAWGV